MRFKGTFTDLGVTRLEKAFLPTLDKCGKSVQVLLTEEEVNIIQTPEGGNGPCVAARINSDVLFMPQSFKIISKHHNMIAFGADLGLLLKVLRSASNNNAEQIDVKLTLKPVQIPGQAAPQNLPFLNFSARGSNVSLVQDLPITKPYVSHEVDAVAAAKEPPSLSPFYLDVKQYCKELQAMLDKMKTICETIVLSATKAGDLYIDVSGVNVQLGAQVQGLTVYPQTVQASHEVDRSLSVSDQLMAAMEAGDAMSVELSVKQLIKLFQVVPLSDPSQILCGIGDASQHLHVMFVYPHHGYLQAEAPYDDTVALSFRVPVCEQHR